MEEDKLFYYSKSANKQVGKGVNEFVSNYNDYNELNKIKDWRKMLSNFYVAEFTYNGKTYYTAEHAFQAKNNIMKEILLCKFTQNIELGNVLLLTKHAILLHGAKGIPISRQYDLEEVRNYLQL